MSFLDTNSDEMAAKIGALLCDLGVMRAALVQAEATASEGFSGPEADAFADRCAAVNRAIAELIGRLDGVPSRVLGAGDMIMHARRDRLAAALGPGAQALNSAANWLGL